MENALSPFHAEPAQDLIHLALLLGLDTKLFQKRAKLLGIDR